MPCSRCRRSSSMAVSRRLFIPKHVTKASNRVDQFHRMPAIYFLTKEPKKRVKGVVFNFTVEPPDGLDNRVSRQDAAGVPHHEFEQQILGLGKMNLRPCTGYSVSYRI